MGSSKKKLKAIEFFDIAWIFLSLKNNPN